MSLNIKALAKPATSNYPKAERVPEGTYPARLVQLVSVGVQETEWKGVVKQLPKIILTFELPTETITINGEEQPRWLSIEFTLLLADKSNLTPVVKALDPKGECKDLSDLLGKPCMVQVGSTSTGKAKITSIVAPMKGMPVAEIYNPAKMLAFDFDNPDLEMFATFPQFMQEKIKSAINYNGFADGVQAKPASKPALTKAKPQPAFDEDEGDDLPF
jgi:hypothetical protein